MTLAEKLIKKVAHLPPARQAEVLEFAEFLEHKENRVLKRRDPQGLLADQPSNLILDDFSAAHRESWSGFPRENPR